jgi:hypothetical protein|tara:strand:+ start:536 stop:700 length:165 start_codon:yes stop_codon:yes gene_type:complete
MYVGNEIKNKKGKNMKEENIKNCPKCDAPTLEQTNTQENCYNCGYDKEYYGEIA